MREQDKEKEKTNGTNVRPTSKSGLKLENIVKGERSEDRNTNEKKRRTKNMLLMPLAGGGHPTTNSETSA